MSIIGVQISHAMVHPAGADFCGMCDPGSWIVGDAAMAERIRAQILKKRGRRPPPPISVPGLAEAVREAHDEDAR